MVAWRALGLVAFSPLLSLSVSWSLLMWKSSFMLPQPQLWAVLTAFSAVKDCIPKLWPHINSSSCNLLVVRCLVTMMRKGRCVSCGNTCCYSHLWAIRQARRFYVIFFLFKQPFYWKTRAGPELFNLKLIAPFSVFFCDINLKTNIILRIKVAMSKKSWGETALEDTHWNSSQGFIDSIFNDYPFLKDCTIA